MFVYISTDSNIDKNVIIFNGILYNPSQSYNTNNGKFTTAFPGTYLIQSQISRSGVSDYHLIQNYNRIAEVRSSKSIQDGFSIASFTGVLELDQGDTVYLEARFTGLIENGTPGRSFFGITLLQIKN